MVLPFIPYRIAHFFFAIDVQALFQAGDCMFAVPEIRCGDNDGIEILFGELLGHEIDFLDTDPVFTRDAAAQFDAFVEDVMSCGEGAFDLD